MSLRADVHVPPDGVGLQVTRSDIRIDLNGHDIVGEGAGTGISIQGRSGVTVTNGRIRGCGQGVVIQGGGPHRLAGLVIQGNQGNGVQIVGSDQNTLTGCTVLENTQMGLLLQDASGNEVKANR